MKGSVGAARTFSIILANPGLSIIILVILAVLSVKGGATRLVGLATEDIAYATHGLQEFGAGRI
ncbi:hypothetical protein KDI_00920 [Dictyobacter arantiisoli]|uniref:Uncharacterized protein n=1 Tax=Dictyobacter arantiisoli TaxID=2014874 RepID=A0A5A5T5F0_9CHLR|nr:hypothetical protein KDI_00920 [Dictyobacter arantiisoli]